MAASSIPYRGIGVLGLLGILFVALKLTNIISWSWWWVTLPFWGELAVLGLIIVVTVFLSLIVGFSKGRG